MSVDSKFNHQAFLTSHLDQIASNIKNDFDYISMIDTYNKSLSETFALLNGKTETFSFTKLKSYQYSALLPKIRIYRVDSNDEGGNEYEFIFKKDNKLNMEVLGKNIIRDNSAGIKSINWTLAGTNPVTAEKNIECSIEFYFSSINAFSGGNYDRMLSLWKDPNNKLSNFKEFDNTDNLTTTNYWALLFHPSFKNDSSKYDTTKFRIKAVIGWENIEPNFKQEIFGDQFPNLEDELQDSNLVMYLNLVKHDFSFREDGSVVVKADYIGSIENGMFNYKYDLFRGLKSRLNQLNNATILLQDPQIGPAIAENINLDGSTFFTNGDSSGNYRENTLYRQQNRLKLLKQLKENSGQNIVCGTEKEKMLIEKLRYVPTEAYDKIIEDNEKELEVIKEYLEKQEGYIKNQFYGSLMKKLITTKDKDNKKIYRLYSITLSKTDITDWIDWKNRKIETEQDSTDITKNSVSTQPPSLFSLNTQFVNSIQDVKVNINEVENRVNEGETENLLQTLSNDSDKNEINASDLIIYYTTIGSILDSAHSIIENGTIPNVSAEFGGPLSAFDKKEFERNKIVFSSFDENKLANIANIPISYDALLYFLIEKIYKLQKSEYSLYSFIKDVITSLVEPALNNRIIANDTINKYSNISLATNIITLKSDEQQPPLDKWKVANRDSIIDLSQVLKKDLKKYYPSSPNNKGNYYFYYFIYDKYLKDFDGKGDPTDDAKKGIYHYTVAQDYGLVKSINFKRNDQPYLRESKSVGKKTIFLGQFRDIYAADVKMVGNNIYTPGMLLLLKPSVEFGKVIGSEDNTDPSFSQITGVGGYYSVVKVSNTIDENGYSTNLDCLFHSNQPKSKKSINGSNCDESLQDLLNDPTVTVQLNKIIEQLREVAKEQEAFETAKTAALDTFKEAANELTPESTIGKVAATAATPFITVAAPYIAAGVGIKAAYNAYEARTNVLSNPEIDPNNFPKEEEN